MTNFITLDNGTRIRLDAITAYRRQKQLVQVWVGPVKFEALFEYGGPGRSMEGPRDAEERAEKFLDSLDKLFSSPSLPVQEFIFDPQYKPQPTPP